MSNHDGKQSFSLNITMTTADSHLSLRNTPNCPRNNLIFPPSIQFTKYKNKTLAKLNTDRRILKIPTPPKKKSKKAKASKRFSRATLQRDFSVKAFPEY